MTKKPASMIFNILAKKVGRTWIAHCLELDIVATASSQEEVKDEIISLIKAQVDYAFSNNNLDYLYRPAPSEVWKEFYDCNKQVEESIKIRSAFQDKGRKLFVPPWIIAKTYFSEAACGV